MRFTLLLIILAAASWGTTGVTLRLVGAVGAGALVVGASRMGVAAPLLAASARSHAGSRGSFSLPLVAAGVCMALYQLCYFSAVPLAGVAMTALLAICSAPLLVSVLARLVLGERITPARIAGLVVGVSGAGLLVAGGTGGLSFRSGLGSLLALGAGLSYALYVVCTKASLGRTSALWLTSWTFSVAALALVPVLFVFPAATVSLWREHWPWLLYLGAVPTAGAYWLYTRGLSRVPAVAATVAGLVEPLTATLLAMALFGERLGAVGGLGAGLLVLAVLIFVGTTGEAVARRGPEALDRTTPVADGAGGGRSERVGRH